MKDRGTTEDGDGDAAAKGNRLLWVVGAAFAVLLAGWATFLMLAARHPVQSVPVVTQPGSRP